MRGVVGHEFFVLAGASGVGEAETDQHRHDASERKGRNRTPKGYFGDQAEAVGLEQETSQRGALEDGLDLGLGAV